MCNRRRRIALAALIILCCVAVIAWLFWEGILWFNQPDRSQYPIRGVDVSSYQGEIDWPVLAEQGIQFAYIKATEGSSYTDPYFSQNLNSACQTNLRVGAYHFFSFDSPGVKQAENFIASVPANKTLLPPVVDLEYYADKAKNPPTREDAHKILKPLLNTLEQQYGYQPILYTTIECYDRYLSGEFQDYDIWIRDVLTVPTLKDGRQWTFWQYSHRGRLDGYHGPERFIDLNVFYGSVEQWEQYGLGTLS